MMTNSIESVKTAAETLMFSLTQSYNAKSAAGELIPLGAKNVKKI